MTQLSFLTAAVNKAGLGDALNATRKISLTFFAPTNDAFIAAGFKSINDLAAIPANTLQSMLWYFVLGTKVTSNKIPQAANTPVNPLNGQPRYATRTANNSVFVNGVFFINANIGCTSGVIHVIDRALMPATGIIVEIVIANPDLSLLVAAVLRTSTETTDVKTVLSGIGPLTVFALPIMPL